MPLKAGAGSLRVNGTISPEPLPSAGELRGRPRKSLTIGAVCKLLKDEFTDISISKIRYLEDQKLLSPRRTQGGYRLYSPADVSRLRTILRLQRDAFLPLRVIRQELAAGRIEEETSGSGAATEQRAGLRTSVLEHAPKTFPLDQLLEYTGVDERLVRELEEFGVIGTDTMATILPSREAMQ